MTIISSLYSKILDASELRFHFPFGVDSHCVPYLQINTLRFQCLIEMSVRLYSVCGLSVCLYILCGCIQSTKQQMQQITEYPQQSSRTMLFPIPWLIVANPLILRPAQYANTDQRSIICVAYFIQLDQLIRPDYLLFA